MTTVRGAPPGPEATILKYLSGQPRKARFVTELEFALGKMGLQRSDLEALLGELEDRGALLVRDHYCADPHLEGADLRIVGVIETTSEVDGTDRAVRDIEAVWEEWLAAYLSEHRCG